MIHGLDTNILCYSLDPAFPEHARCKKYLLEVSPESRMGINPTVLHETYHTLVFGQKWASSEARLRLHSLIQHPYFEFYNQTRRISQMALDLASHYSLGGRDSLIIANLMANDVPVLLTHDDEILKLKRIVWRRSAIKFEDPVRA